MILHLKSSREIMHNPKAPPAARVAAATQVINRRYGLPMQTTQIEQTITKRAEDMTDDELATIAARGLPKTKQASSTRRRSGSSGL
jgi:hypothetical protein